MLEAERLGLKLSTETAQAAEAFNDNLTSTQSLVFRLGISLATELLAPLRVVTDAIREGQGEATGFAAILGGALKTTLEAILILGVNVAYVFKSWVPRSVGWPRNSPRWHASTSGVLRRSARPCAKMPPRRAPRSMPCRHASPQSAPGQPAAPASQWSPDH